MFHIELRQFPHVARAFNLTADELERRFVRPWIRQEAIDLDDRRWSPDRATLTIYEAPELRRDQIGMGRGWANVTRSGEDVTEPVLGDAVAPRSSVQLLKEEIESRCADDALSIADVRWLADERLPGRRVSERVAVAEQAVWELLHHGRLSMISAGNPDDTLAADLWQPILLSWETWSEAEPSVLLAAPASES